MLSNWINFVIGVAAFAPLSFVLEFNFYFKGFLCLVGIQTHFIDRRHIKKTLKRKQLLLPDTMWLIVVPGPSIPTSATTPHYHIMCWRITILELVWNTALEIYFVDTSSLRCGERTEKQQP